MAVLAPASKKQEQFINSKAFITVFGGSAGSGKSYMGLMDVLKNVHKKTFRAIIVRRTTPQLTAVGGLWDEALQMYTQAIEESNEANGTNHKIKASEKSLKITFPSGAQVKLQHYEHIKDWVNYQGIQAGLALIDEACQFEAAQIEYIISRLRNAKDKSITPQIKLTCNPEADSFLRYWLDDAGYLDREGFPIEAMSGVITYTGNVAGKREFRKTLEEWNKDFPNAEPQTFTFIPATCRDNPVLLANDPMYLTNLENLPRIERARLLEGNWFVRETSSGLFKREWCDVVSAYEVPRNVVRVRSWDKAASEPSEKYPDPDYTVGLRISRCQDSGILYVEDMVRFRSRPAKVQQTIEDTAMYDGKDTVVTIPQDGGAAGVMESQQSASKLFSKGFTCKIKKTNNTGKGKRFEPVSALAENGLIQVVKGSWNEDFFNELEAFTGASRSATHDDKHTMQCRH